MTGTRALLCALLVAAATIVAAGFFTLHPEPTVFTSTSTITATPQSPTTKKPVSTTLQLDFEWTKDPGTRILDGSVPYVCRLKDGRFRLYYCGEGGILSAISADGLTFQREAGIRIARADGLGNPESIVGDATIVDLPDGRMRMYYKGASGPGGPGQGVHRIFSAVSSDGLSFQKEGLRIDSERTGDRGWASVPEAVKLPDGKVRIYYVSGDFEASGGIMSALSLDGLNFQKESGARVKALVDPAITILPDGRYLLLAVVLPSPPDASQKPEQPIGIYSFTSDDGLVFSNKQVVLQEEGVFDPSIIELDDDTYRVFYGKDIGGQSGQPNVVTKSVTGKARHMTAGTGMSAFAQAKTEDATITLGTHRSRDDRPRSRFPMLSLRKNAAR